jgi:hypothetical protein
MTIRNAFIAVLIGWLLCPSEGCKTSPRPVSPLVKRLLAARKKTQGSVITNFVSIGTKTNVWTIPVRAPAGYEKSLTWDLVVSTNLQNWAMVQDGSFTIDTNGTVTIYTTGTNQMFRIWYHSP